MKKNIIEEFMDCVRIDNESLNERLMADHIINRLKSMGYKPYEDDAASKAGGTAGNVICRIPGDPKKDSVIFLAHMDSVHPCKGKVPIIRGEYIESEGETVLGSDDLSGVAAMLNLAQNLIGNETVRGDTWLVFTIAEEIGLIGARYLDTDSIKADFAYVLDSSGDIGKATISAPSHNTFTAVIKGKSAHAGMEPEKGISAITVASEAINNMILGRIDDETTANIGTIEGGRAINIVCDQVVVKGEIRSRDIYKLNKYTGLIENALNLAANNAGAKVEIAMVREYNSFSVADDEEMLIKYKNALANLGIKYEDEQSGGGSDTNIIYNKGIKALTISCGMERVHSTNERIGIYNLKKLEKLLLELTK